MIKFCYEINYFHMAEREIAESSNKKLLYCIILTVAYKLNLE